jgi:hypothetical protein
VRGVGKGGIFVSRALNTRLFVFVVNGHRFTDTTAIQLTNKDNAVPLCSINGLKIVENGHFNFLSLPSICFVPIWDQKLLFQEPRFVV